MLASDTQAIAEFLRQTMIAANKLADGEVEDHFADTRDTLCYATNDNQTAVINLLRTEADFAIVVGGYNSSNTSHLVELCEAVLPTYFVNSEENILSPEKILHYRIAQKKEVETTGYLPSHSPARVLVTSGASCPDALVEGVIVKLNSFFPGGRGMAELIASFSRD